MITAVNGICAGGGFHWVADADIVIAASDAQFFDPHVSIGQVVSIEAIGLIRKMPAEAVMRMAFVGRYERMSAQRAYELGMISQIVDPPERLREAAQELAEMIARNSPAAMAATKRALWGAFEAGLTDACRAGAAELVSMWGHPDQAEGPAAFAARREARLAAARAGRPRRRSEDERRVSLAALLFDAEGDPDEVIVSAGDDHRRRGELRDQAEALAVELPRRRHRTRPTRWRCRCPADPTSWPPCSGCGGPARSTCRSTRASRRPSATASSPRSAPPPSSPPNPPEDRASVHVDVGVLDAQNRGLDPDVALIQFTSGTTGRPKAVPLRHSSVLGAARRGGGQPAGLGRRDERERRCRT